jgi:lipid A 3-O-deacylase
MKLNLLGSAMVLAFAAMAAPASARVDELRLGAVHNLRLDHGDLVDGKEGDNVEAELVFSSPDILNILGSPRPYLVASGNVEGNTSFAGAGLLWRLRLSEHWAFEPGFGYIIHDGERDNPFTDGTPQAAQFEEQHQLLGSRDLFRTTLALENVVSPHHAWQLYYEHMSHGQILDKGRNQGLDEVGVRWIFRFNPDPAD